MMGVGTRRLDEVDGVGICDLEGDFESGEVVDPPLEEEEREPLDCELQPRPDSRKIEDLIGSGEFESSRLFREDLWLAIILMVVVTNR